MDIKNWKTSKIPMKKGHNVKYYTKYYGITENIYLILTNKVILPILQLRNSFRKVFPSRKEEKYEYKRYCQ